MAGIADVAKTAGLHPLTCPHCGRRIGTGIRVFESLFRAILQHVKRGEEVRVRGFGTFRRIVTAKRRLAAGVTRRMGSKVYDAGGQVIGPVSRVSFSQGRQAKRFLNKKEGKR